MVCEGKQQGIRKAVDDEISSTGGDGGAVREAVPELVFAHHGRGIADVWKGVSSEVDVRWGRVVDLEVLVVG